MEYKETKIEELLSEIVEGEDITLSDIPDMDLYMDQVITLFEKKLKHQKRVEEDKIMTKTMINNYAKAKILPPVKSKKYNRQQLILLTLIYNLKQQLSLTDISNLFQPTLKDIQGEDNRLPSIEELYDTYLELKRGEKLAFKEDYIKLSENIREKSKKFNASEPELTELLLQVSMLISRANLEKKMAEKIIDEYFLTSASNSHKDPSV